MTKSHYKEGKNGVSDKKLTTPRGHLATENQHSQVAWEIDCSLWAERYREMMLRYTQYRVRDREIAEDIVQVTLLAGLQAKSSFLGNSTEKSWLFGILRNKIMDHFREVKKNRTYELLPKDGKNPLDPEKAIENKQLAQMISSCLNILSDKFRNVIILKEIECLSTQEICNELDINPNNLRVLLHRARKQLKKILELNQLVV